MKVAQDMIMKWSDIHNLVQPEIVLIIIQNKNLPLLCLGRSLRGSAMTLIITRYYVLLHKFLLCRTPGGSMANW